MNKVQSILSKGLDPEIAQSLHDRIDNLLRQLWFLGQTKKPSLVQVLGSGYSQDRLETILVLAAFQHTVVGPLAAAARESKSGLATKVPVHHGNTVLDHGSSDRVRSMARDFDLMLKQLHIRSSWLSALYADDIIYRISKSLETPDK